MKRSESIGPALALALTTLLSTPAAWASTQDYQGTQQVIHSSGATLQGVLTSTSGEHSPNQRWIKFFSLKTPDCGILAFELSPLGLTCLNCRHNSAVLSQCRMPRSNNGWQLQAQR